MEVPSWVLEAHKKVPKRDDYTLGRLAEDEGYVGLRVFGWEESLGWGCRLWVSRFQGSFTWCPNRVVGWPLGWHHVTTWLTLVTMVVGVVFSGLRWPAYRLSLGLLYWALFLYLSQLGLLRCSICILPYFSLAGTCLCVCSLNLGYSPSTNDSIRAFEFWTWCPSPSCHYGV